MTGLLHGNRGAAQPLSGGVWHDATHVADQIDIQFNYRKNYPACEWKWEQSNEHSQTDAKPNRSLACQCLRTV